MNGMRGLSRLLAGIAQRRPLVGGRQEGRAEVVRPSLREVLADRHVSREVLVFAAEPVRDPRTQARADERVAAGVPLQHGTAVPRVGAVHRVDHAEVVGPLGQVGEQRADRQPALAVLLEIERPSRRGCPSDSETRRTRGRLLRRQRPTAVARKSGLGSNVSRCDGPPNMKSMITRFTLGGK